MWFYHHFLSLPEPYRQFNYIEELKKKCKNNSNSVSFPDPVGENAEEMSLKDIWPKKHFILIWRPKRNHRAANGWKTHRNGYLWLEHELAWLMLKLLTTYMALATLSNDYKITHSNRWASFFHRFLSCLSGLITVWFVQCCWRYFDFSWHIKPSPKPNFKVCDPEF